MVNRNAVRHLALVAGVLLCFFVYMGYRFRGDASGPAADAPADIASLYADPDVHAPSGANLMTMQGSQDAGRPAPIRPPVDIPIDPASVRSGSEVIPDIAALIQTEGAFGSASSAPPPASAPARAPSGSIEESDSGNAITGLSPDAGDDFDLLANLTPPSAAGRADTETASASRVVPPPASVSAAPAASASPLPLPDDDFGIFGTSAPAVSAPAPVSPPSPVSSPSSALRPSASEPPVQPPGGQAGGNSSRPAQPPPATPERRTPPSPSVVTPPPAPERPPAAASPVSPAVSPARAAVPAGAVEPSESLRIYVIRPGDTLSRIASRELGSITLADNIYLLNRDVISDPDHLMVGEKIRLPVRESLPPAGVAVPRPTDAAAAPPAAAEHRRVHRVMPGETLSSISARYYGASSGWRFIYEANTAVITNPNRVAVGTELVIPAYGDD